MKTVIKKMSSLALLAMGLSAFAGSEGGVGNGGVSVVCRHADGSIASAELLDIYEGRELYQRTYSEDALSVETRLQIMQLALVKRPDAIKRFQDELTTIYSNQVFVSKGNELELTNDALPIIRKKGCKLEQVANYTDNGEVFISQEIYEEFNNLNKAALYTHEAFYSIYRKKNRTHLSINSRDSRKLTAYLMSNNIDSEVVSVLLKKHINGAESGESCGLEGTIEQKIRDCSLVKGNYILITRTHEHREIFKDNMSGLIWGDRLPFTETHAKAGAACDGLPKIDEKSWSLPTKEEFETAIPITLEFSGSQHFKIIG